MSAIHDPRPLGGSAASSAGIATATDASGAGPSPSRGAGDDAMCAVLAGNWWAVALRGVFAILFGLIALLAPGSAILSLVLLFAAYMLVDGIVGIVSAVRAAKREERWGLLLLEGLADIATGGIAFLWPGITVIAFVLLMAAWALTSGGLRVGAAFKLTKEHGRWWLIFSGLVSIVFGVLLAMAPLWGARVLTWWLGVYALVFGGSLLVVAFKLRAQKDRSPTASTVLPSAAG
jgi:uncharacterized membrane protein HdeD (DUF308 family)